MKKILDDRKKIFNSQLSRLHATAADLKNRKKSMRNVWATTLEEMKDLSVRCGTGSIVHHQENIGAPVYSDVVSGVL